MSRDLDYYERKMRDLQLENEVLRNHLSNSQRSYTSVAPEAIIELNSRNQKLERTAYNYENSIKYDLSSYLAESAIKGQCYYRNRYYRVLSSSSRNPYRLLL